MSISEQLVRCICQKTELKFISKECVFIYTGNVFAHCRLVLFSLSLSLLNHLAAAPASTDDAWGAPPSDSSPSGDPFGDGASKKNDPWGAPSSASDGGAGKLTDS